MILDDEEGIIEWCEANMAGLETVRAQAVAGHHTPEDRPELIGAAVAAWADRLGLRS